MTNDTYIPRSLRDAGKQVRYALIRPLGVLPKREFVRAWCSIAYLFPGLHPDEYQNADGGWPRVLRRFAVEAWRRAEAGELRDDELYCYKASKVRLLRERRIVRLEYSKKPWFFTDHFAV